jgi:hypothetical protein
VNRTEIAETGKKSQKSIIMAPDLSHITSEIQQKASELQPGNEKHRSSLLQSARALVNELERPHERIMRMLYHEDAIFMGTKVLIDLGIFKILAKTTEPLSAAS